MGYVTSRLCSEQAADMTTEQSEFDSQQEQTFLSSPQHQLR
jgi:hypothetical protein